MPVQVIVLERFVDVLVLVLLGEVEPDARSHQSRGAEKRRAPGFVKDDHAGDGAGERRSREVR